MTSDRIAPSKSAIISSSNESLKSFLSIMFSLTQNTSSGLIPYGIKPEDVFWVKENIIDKKDLRLSLDEEIIADLLGAILSDVTPPSRVSVLDGYYNYDEQESDNRGSKVEKQLHTVGIDHARNQFLFIIDEIKKIFYNQSDTIIQHILDARVY